MTLSPSGSSDAVIPGDPERRRSILRAAIDTFARYGYRKTSMDDVARDAGLSRPGLYFLFSNKNDLFQAAVRQLLDDALEQTSTALQVPDQAIDICVADAIDKWLGRYVGPQSITDVGKLLETSQSQLGEMYSEYMTHCQELLASAIAEAVTRGDAELPDGATALDAATTAYAAANDLKHRVADRAEFTEHIRTAALLIIRPRRSRRYTERTHSTAIQRR